MNNKAQSALEYLLSYGWVLILIVIIGGALYAFGVFNPGTVTSTRVSGVSNFQFDDIAISEDGELSLMLGAKTTYDAEIKDINYYVSGYNCINTGDEADFSLNLGSTELVTLSPDSSCTLNGGEVITINISIVYTTRTNLEHTDTGVINLMVGYSDTGLSCWGIGSVCNSSCTFSSLGATSYYTDPGCSATCDSAGTFYVPSGSCSGDGTGDCYLMSASTSKSTTCTQGSSCGSSCSGTPDACSTFTSSCVSCGCSLSSSTTDVWTENFASNSDWATWQSNGNGIAYVNDATNCVNDANDDCFNADGGGFSTEYLYKQSSEDLSDCDSGTAYFNVDHITEAGDLESSDCVYVAFSSNGGVSWSSDYTIFCDDNPSSTYNVNIPDIYLTNNFRIRLGIYLFGGPGEEGWIDDLSVYCDIPDSCGGSPDACSTHGDQTSCEDCGCTWSSTSWNWNLAGSTSGYESYTTCIWYS